jgi:hypothetical protein
MAQSHARTWLRAMVISLVLSGLVTFSARIIHAEGAQHVPPVEWNKVEKMSYGDAVAYLDQRAQRTSGWEAFLNHARSWRYWGQFLYDWAFLFMFAFVCCGAVIRWGGLQAAPSNNTVETDARKSGARGSP